MKMTLEFMWHEIKASVAGQISCNQISKHGVTTIDNKYGYDNKIHVVLSQLSCLLAQRPSTLVLMMINSCSYVY